METEKVNRVKVRPGKFFSFEVRKIFIDNFCYTLRTFVFWASRGVIFQSWLRLCWLWFCWESGWSFRIVWCEIELQIRALVSVKLSGQVSFLQIPKSTRKRWKKMELCRRSLSFSPDSSEASRVWFCCWFVWVKKFCRGGFCKYYWGFHFLFVTSTHVSMLAILLLEVGGHLAVLNLWRLKMLTENFAFDLKLICKVHCK